MLAILSGVSDLSQYNFVNIVILFVALIWPQTISVMIINEWIYHLWSEPFYFGSLFKDSSVSIMNVDGQCGA